MLSQRIRKRYYKTLRTSEINSLMSPPSMDSNCNHNQIRFHSHNVILIVLLPMTLAIIMENNIVFLREHIVLIYLKIYCVTWLLNSSQKLGIVTGLHVIPGYPYIYFPPGLKFRNKDQSACNTNKIRHFLFKK